MVFTRQVLQLYSLSGYVVFSLSFKEVVIVLVNVKIFQKQKENAEFSLKVFILCMLLRDLM